MESRFKVKRLKHHGFILLCFVGLVMFINWPLVAHIRTHVIGRVFEDAFEALWQLSWMDTAIFERHSNPFYSPDIYYPQGWYTTSGAQPSWFFLFLAPLVHLTGVVVAYNMTLLGTFVLAGFGVYLLVFRLINCRLPAFIAGCVYISAPILTIRLGGHVNILISMALLPYATLGFVKVFQGETWRWRQQLIAGVTLGLTIVGMWYFLFMATLPLIILSIFVSEKMSWRVWAGRLLGVGVVTLIVILPFAYITQQARREMLPEGGTYSLGSSDGNGISLDYLFALNANQPLWGGWSTEKFPIISEHNFISIGYTTMVLGVLGIIFAERRNKRPFIIMGAASLVLAMGLTLHWHNERVVFTVPGIVAAFFQEFYADIPLPPDKIAVPLPGLVLYHFLPFYDAMRAWARFTIPFMLAMAVLSGYGVDFLINDRGRIGYYLAILAGVLIVLEGATAPYINFTEVARNDRSANEWLAEQGTGATLIEYPRPWANKIAMYSQSLHGQRVVNGYMSFEPTFLQNVSTQLGEWPNDAALLILRDWGVQYIVINGNQSEAFEENILSQIGALDGLCHIKTFDDGFMDFNQTDIYQLVAVQEACPE